MSCSPNPGTSMSSAFGKCEQHNIMIQGLSDRRVLWPVVGKVIDKLPFPTVHHSFSDSTIRIIWRGYDLNIRSILIKGMCISFPFIESWTQEFCLILISLQVINVAATCINYKSCTENNRQREFIFPFFTIGTPRGEKLVYNFLFS
jgi:hypothetical protein